MDPLKDFKQSCNMIEFLFSKDSSGGRTYSEWTGARERPFSRLLTSFLEATNGLVCRKEHDLDSLFTFRFSCYSLN